ncbi:MAG: hypothetical protein KAS15_07700 [Nanoarchaeota archaeon]|nr:hypothetical protein [Nanoarchaeota archaeon]MCK5628986.1 hypothetical protein [Nanoarchaeota archaeon]
MKEAPIFIKIDQYKDVLDILHLAKSKIRDARVLIEKINELKNAEDTEIKTWQNSLDEVEKRVMFIDKSLFEPESL